MTHGYDKPNVTGWLVIDLSGYVDQQGFLTHDGDRYAWSVLAGCPAGINIRLNLGGLRVIGYQLIPNLLDAGILQANHVLVEGTEPKGIEAVITAIRGLRELQVAA